MITARKMITGPRSFDTTSGAVVIFLEDNLTLLKIAKTDSQCRRLKAQGEYMSRGSRIVFPEVISMFSHGYSMPILHEIDWEVSNKADVFVTMRVILANNVWNNKTVLGKNWLLRLGQYVRNRMSESNISTDLFKRVNNQVDRLFKIGRSLDVCQIHGDPTLDNTMLSREMELKIVDPLPYDEFNSCIPPLKAVDLGKMLQSAFGYEQNLGVKGFEKLDFGELEKVILWDESESTRLASLIFCLIHYVRLLSYQRVDKYIPMLKTLNTVLNYVENS